LPAVRQFAGRGVLQPPRRISRQQESQIQIREICSRIRCQNTPSAPERRLAPFAAYISTPAFGVTSPIEKDTDGGGENVSPSPHGEVNAANAAMWGGWRIACGLAIRREGRSAPPPARNSNPNPLSEHSLRCKRSGATSPIDKDIDGGGEGASGGNPSFVYSCPIR